jgi:hypothetical protein
MSLSAFPINELDVPYCSFYQATCREAEKKRAKAGRGQGQYRGETGDGARELLLPWTANPGAQKEFDPEHLLAGGLQGQQPCVSS